MTILNAGNQRLGRETVNGTTGTVGLKTASWSSYVMIKRATIVYRTTIRIPVNKMIRNAGERPWVYPTSSAKRMSNALRNSITFPIVKMMILSAGKSCTLGQIAQRAIWNAWKITSWFQIVKNKPIKSNVTKNGSDIQIARQTMENVGKILTVWKRTL